MVSSGFECEDRSRFKNSGLIIQGNISRRDIADGIRSTPELTVPTAEDVHGYNQFMRGLSDDEALSFSESAAGGE